MLENTRARYSTDEVYTFIGDVLVAVNPFAPLPIYGAEVMVSFVGSELGTVRPHVFAMGEAAFVRVRAGCSTALVMSGESGSGKTETTKHLLAYIAWRSERLNNDNAANSCLAGATLRGSESPLRL